MLAILTTAIYIVKAFSKSDKTTCISLLTNYSNAGIIIITSMQTHKTSEENNNNACYVFKYGIYEKIITLH